MKRKYIKISIRLYEDELRVLDKMRGKIPRTTYAKKKILEEEVPGTKVEKVPGSEFSRLKSESPLKTAMWSESIFVKNEKQKLVKGESPSSFKTFCSKCLGIREIKNGKCVICKTAI